MSNGIKGLEGEVFFAAVRAQRVWVVCDEADDGAVMLMHSIDGANEQESAALALAAHERWIASGDSRNRRYATCATIRMVYVDDEQSPANNLCDRARADAGLPPVYVRPGLRQHLDHNHHLYQHKGQASARARTRYDWRPEGPTVQEGAVLRVELELCEPEGLSQDESYAFAERMIQVWAQRAEDRRTTQPLVLKKQRVRKPPPINPLTGRPLTRRQQKLERDRKSLALRTDLDAAERAYALRWNLHTATLEEIRTRMALELCTVNGRLEQQLRAQGLPMALSSSPPAANGGGGGGGGVVIVAAPRITGAGTIEGNPAIVVTGGGSDQGDPQ